MTGGTRIIAFGSAGEAPADQEFLLTGEIAEAERPAVDHFEGDISAQDDAPPSIRRRSDWLWPALAALVVLGWTAAFIASNWPRIAPGGPIGLWVGLIGDWAPPVMLVAITWLIVMRNSRREAVRFGDAARLLSDESARLEHRLATVNRELSLAREFITAQSRDLETLGRLAADRLSQNADRLQSLIRENDSRIEAIGDVSAAALDNMEKLRGNLPVIANSAKDVTNNIGNAGRAAQAQLQEMVGGFGRLNEFGEASDRQVRALRALVEETMGEFTRQSSQLGEIATARFAALGEKSVAFREELEGHEADALAAIRTRAAALSDEVERTRLLLDGSEAESLTSLRARLSALRDETSTIARSIRDGESRALESWQAALAQIEEGLRTASGAIEDSGNRARDAAGLRLTALLEDIARADAGLADSAHGFAAEISRRRAEIAADDAQALGRLSEQLSLLDREIATRRAGHDAQSAELATKSARVAEQLERVSHHMAEITTHGDETERRIIASLATLTEQLTASQSALDGTDGKIAALTDSSVRLLELIQASSEHSRDQLPQALASGEKRLAEFEARVITLERTAADAREHGAALVALVTTSSNALQTIRDDMAELQSGIDDHGMAHDGVLHSLRTSLETIEAHSERLARSARDELAVAIDALAASAQGAVAGIRDNGASAISALAAQLGRESSAALDQAMRISAAETSGQIEQAAAHAAGFAREAAVQMRDQLAKVNELAGNLERRVAHARQRAEEQVDNDFTRRVALITESLNSNAIDITKALSSEVSDTAWAAYLRGDRGIFTRRAVRLLESGEAKAIATAYERDGDFREHVQRYIHDFEAILRQVLSARDGHALGVTLLSSDMGKLYVALAQAIERLRA